jgi:hypothetical protein
MSYPEIIINDQPWKLIPLGECACECGQKNNCLTLKRLREFLDYDLETGIFIRKISKRGHRAGVIAGYVHPLGYRRITIDRQTYGAHQLAWFYVTGVWPLKMVDHRNGKRDDNWFKNLREADHSINAENQRKAPKTNKSGLLGVHNLGKRFISKPWMSTITVKGKHNYLGTFATPEEAHAAYLRAKRELHVGCTI